MQDSSRSMLVDEEKYQSVHSVATPISIPVRQQNVNSVGPERCSINGRWFVQPTDQSVFR